MVEALLKGTKEKSLLGFALAENFLSFFHFVTSAYRFRVIFSFFGSLTFGFLTIFTLKCRLPEVYALFVLILASF
jgi:hypothetical protein